MGRFKATSLLVRTNLPVDPPHKLPPKDHASSAQRVRVPITTSVQIPKFSNIHENSIFCSEPLPAVMSTGPRGGRTRQQWTRRNKRSRGSTCSEEEVRLFFEQALTLQASPTVFDLDSAAARAMLADAMWQSTDLLLGDDSLSAANGSLAAVLEVVLRNSYRASNDSSLCLRTAFRVESIMADLQRAQSQKKMPLLTARLSCAFMRAQLPRQLWELISMLVPGVLASYSWTEDFVGYASSRRPPCKYDELPHVGGVVFDNYSRKVLYSSQATVESSGYFLNMTNWGSIKIPRLMAPPGFDATQICESLAP